MSQSLAFENILQDGKQFAEKLIHTFHGNNDESQLLSVATDGETYGHHHKFGDMALAIALQSIDNKFNVRLTNFAEYLNNFPAEHEIEIVEKTSWSCAHGVERWKSDCGCETGGQPKWNQKWRDPLRQALDWFQDRVDLIVMKAGKDLFKDPWEARNHYIDVRVNPLELDKFLDKHTRSGLKESEKITVLKLLELQRHAMLMYTSCGWFFNDISGIETEQILLHQVP